MIKTLAIGLWACAVTLTASYVAATWRSGGAVTAAIIATDPTLKGLEYRKPAPITVPMISDGRLRGYVVAKIVYTANAQALHDFPVDPQPFVLDEAFRRIYTDGKIEFDQMSKYNLGDITAAIKSSVNKRLGSDLIQDVLIDELNYVDKASLKQAAATTAEK